MRPILMSSSSLLLLAGLVSIGASGRAAAAEIVDTIGLGTDTPHSIASLPAAESFVATGPGIGDVELELDRTDATPSGSVVITIASNSGNAPGATLDTIYTLPESSLPLNTETLFNFVGFPDANPLVSGTTYWLEAAKSGSVQTNVFLTTSAPTVGAGTEYDSFGRGGAVTTPLMTVCISDDDACTIAHPAAPADTFTGSAPPPPPPPVSEPATVGLIGLGLTALAFVRRRAERRSAALVAAEAG